jgi:hypothetical protein
MEANPAATPRLYDGTNTSGGADEIIEGEEAIAGQDGTLGFSARLGGWQGRWIRPGSFDRRRYRG